ncbi:hypothetical protein CDQ84_17920 [Clostridium thermosuccinogenes]|jgi:uncharacterized protein with ParB-like and HNH nuclease domain|uniref:DUF262 domain-containing protein n=1 Tax=Clostridium thermosuccinogenes TaxID=84032 RepID=A0A2K2F6Z1_9CLOT|nr:DUF262 domain-containing protein [Pseudoclostridium thermosuccinogenes]AUS95476.1 hypothetical protein CDO33_02850 [Pseudoclostridium thermosuccinogenes]PNT94538.1 hypothetical protein CDQ85_17880 [Pseudoclostridium thermosuccinogenes]PNT94987.1 hypothetical protein CDQ84_17920 [Pseudoclostridium thermosuccinogenes]
MNKITAHAVNIRTLLNNKYTVQYYQREYNWETKQIEELIEDLTNEFNEFYKDGDRQIDVRNYGDYFLGPIILTNDNAIIDGQQRLSSLTLLLIYLNNLQKQQTSLPKVNIDNLIYSEMYGQKTFCINVTEREVCLASLFETGDYDITNEQSESVINLYNRYKDIERIFPDELKGSPLPVFIEWLIDNVSLVEIRTDSEQDAHKVFVTMNDRGLRLTPTEMLKGYLLSEMDDNTIRNKANDLWKNKIVQLKEIEKDGDADFIKNWLRAQYAETIREGKKDAENKDFDIIGTTFHKWVRENKSVMGLNSSADFEKFILKNFRMYADIYIRLKEYSRKFNKDYEYVFYNADRGFTLQYQIILSAIKSDDTQDVVNKKIKMVSCFIDQFISIRIFNFKTVDYSSIRYTVFNITKMIRNKDIKELAEILKRYINNMELTLEGIDGFYLNQFTRRYMLHILSRMTYYVEEQSGINSNFADYVNREQKNPYDIEHIWADDYTQGNHQLEFSTEEEFKDFRNRFGGLLILPKDKNRSLQDMEYSKKVIKYDSENLLARTLNQNCYNNNPLFLCFMNNTQLPFKPYAQFNKAELIERQSLYKEICKKIWDVNKIDVLANS